MTLDLDAIKERAEDAAHYRGYLTWNRLAQAGTDVLALAEEVRQLQEALIYAESQEAHEERVRSALNRWFPEENAHNE
jgi:hypothetical protein